MNQRIIISFATNKASFRTSLGAENDDDSLLAGETNNTAGIPELQQSTLQKHVDNDKKAPIVTVNEVAATPSEAEMRGGDFFASAKAA